MIVSTKERRYSGNPVHVMFMREMRVYWLITMRAANQSSCDRDGIDLEILFTRAYGANKII
jgi:hypothetical protein